MTYIYTPAARRPTWFAGIPLPAVGGDPIGAATQALNAHGWTVDQWEQTGDEWTAHITAGEV